MSATFRKLFSLRCVALLYAYSLFSLASNPTRISNKEQGMMNAEVSYTLHNL